MSKMEQDLYFCYSCLSSHIATGIFLRHCPYIYCISHYSKDEYYTDDNDINYTVIIP